jgi:hypothetical protein
VVHDDEQRMIVVVDAHELRPDERRLVQAERFGRGRAQRLLECTVDIASARNVQCDALEPQRRRARRAVVHYLHRLAVMLHESRAQALMARDERAQTALERVGIERAAETNGPRDVVSTARSRQLVQEP